MKKETIFKHELNESIQANAALNCLKNRNTPKKLNESADFDARFEFRKDLRELASPIAKKAYMIIRKQYGDGMWRQLYMDDCDERGLIDMLNMYAEDGLNPQQIVNKMMGVREDEEDITPPWIGRQYIGGIDFDADGNLQVITPDEDDDDDDYEAPPLFDSEQERHDIALATTYCLGESFIDNDGDLDDIYYAVLKYFDSTYDAPATADDNDILQWCRTHYKQIESMIN